MDRRRPRPTLRPGPLLTLLALAGCGARDGDRLTFLAVGQGDCAVLQSDGATLVVDDGPGYGAPERLTLPGLRRLGVGRVDALVLTHPDADHVSGTPALLRRYPEARVMANGTFRHHPDLVRLLAGRPVTWLPPRGAFRLGRWRCEFVCPTPEGDDDNSGSVMMRLRRDDGPSAVLTGDAPGGVEERVAPTVEWRADVLKAGHHGSKTSTGATWLAEVRPVWVVFSCGLANRYGHPSAQTLARCAGVRQWRTDRQGDVSFVVRDGRLAPE